MKDVTDRLKFEVKSSVSDRHVSFLTNRIYGGLQAGGMFELHFLLERKPMPNKVTIEVTPEGNEKETSRSTTNEIIRENQATAYMSLETFIALQAWMNQRVAEMEANGIIHKTSELPDSASDE